MHIVGYTCKKVFMDIFDQYLFEELVSEYERSGLPNYCLENRYGCIEDKIFLKRKFDYFK